MDICPLRNKYNARRVELDGFTFDSKREAARYSELKLLMTSGEIAALEIHPRFEIIVNGQKICRYIADFRYHDNETGERITEDVKGYKKGSAYALFRLKKKLMKAVHGIEVLETE